MRNMTSTVMAGSERTRFSDAKLFQDARYSSGGFWARSTHATPLNADQEALAASMRRAWTNFAATGNPSAAAVPWPSINMSSNVLSLVQPQPQLVQNFAAILALPHMAAWRRPHRRQRHDRAYPVERIRAPSGDQRRRRRSRPVMASNQADVRAG